MPTLQPGDVVAVRTPWTIFGWLIRLGARMRGGLGRVDHVAIVHHIGSDGTVHLIEGRPSGVGYATMHGYTLVSSNAAQPKTPEQRGVIVATATSALAQEYDWLAIARDLITCLGVPPVGTRGEFRRRPRRVVCSSLANWCSYCAGLPHPGVADRWCQPDDWDLFNRAEAPTWAMAAQLGDAREH